MFKTWERINEQQYEAWKIFCWVCGLAAAACCLAVWISYKAGQVLAESGQALAESAQALAESAQALARSGQVLETVLNQRLVLETRLQRQEVVLREMRQELQLLSLRQRQPRGWPDARRVRAD